ncbi:MAG: capsular polysaccharide biosynthesis protein [Alphaproteobacteria bacterium]|nr:capsular polysaccharide biosynthesis protein [Alphaproteobacteria bacterium]
MPLIGILSVGILKIPFLELFLKPWGRPIDLRHAQAGDGELAAIAGWGYRPTTERARAEAARLGLPYLALEDGFLRSIELGVLGGAPWSLVVDDCGVYYDCSRPSRLERLIEAELEPEPSTAALLDLFRTANLSKYNAAPDCTPALFNGDPRPLVIVLDQVVGDVSVSAGGSDAASFEDMLTAARDENPQARIVVRSHPDVVAGRRKGYLFDMARARKLPVFAAPVSWPSMLRHAERVYTATSLAGFEALVHGVPVACFGLPFYAGWGLTEDRVPCPRRGRRPTLEALFHAAYERYPRYVDLVHGRPADAVTVARRFAAARAADAENAGAVRLLAVSRRKRPWVSRFVTSRHGTVSFAGPRRRAIRAGIRRGNRLMVWAGQEPTWLDDEARRHGAALTRIEDGFLRSVGLGAEFVPAVSLVVDDLGIYFDPCRESRLERIIAEAEIAPEVLAAAHELRERLIALRLSKYNVGDPSAARIGGRDQHRCILVPGQVENDASIRLGAPGIRTNLGLLAAVRASAPEAIVLYKPHPDVERGLRPGAIGQGDLTGLADDVLAGCDAASAIDQADEVHTITSLLGFEALLRRRKVVTYGLPFYAGLGLTTDVLQWPRPRPRCGLDRLVAAALLLYPRYRDPRTGLPITAFDALDIIAAMRSSARQNSPTPAAGWRGAATEYLLRAVLRQPKKIAAIEP